MLMATLFKERERESEKEKEKEREREREGERHTHTHTHAHTHTHTRTHTHTHAHVYMSHVIICIYVYAKNCNPFYFILKPPNIHPPQPKSKIFPIHIQHGPVHIAIKTLTPTDLPKFIRIRTTFWVPKISFIIIKFRALLDFKGFLNAQQVLIRIVNIYNLGNDNQH